MRDEERGVKECKTRLKETERERLSDLFIAGVTNSHNIRSTKAKSMARRQ